jgi:menaquinone-dependent protoporphyrinogen oxidase
MSVLIAYASQHGATAGIAEHIAERLRAAGLAVDLAEVGDAGDPSRHDACIVGSAVYVGHWRKEAVAWVREHFVTLRRRPVWLFSSGPLGDGPVDDQGRDKREAAAPEEAGELIELVGARSHRVFFGALNTDDLSLLPRLMRLLPAGRRLLVEGDFRDWPEIDAWADAIAALLTAPPSVDDGAQGGRPLVAARR